MTIPERPKIYHIVHQDKLSSIIADGFLWSDAEIRRHRNVGTGIGMKAIKDRRLERYLSCRKGLRVGECVPFYFCPRSVMLYLLYKGNHPELSYRGGQQQIVHLEADLLTTVAWAEQHHQQWAFTLSNAGSSYFEDRCRLDQLGEIDWSAVAARDWSNQKEGKQAEFLMEKKFPWGLVERIGVYNQGVYQFVVEKIKAARHSPRIEILKDWYYG